MVGPAALLACSLQRRQWKAKKNHTSRLGGIVAALAERGRRASASSPPVTTKAETRSSTVVDRVYRPLANCPLHRNEAVKRWILWQASSSVPSEVA
jgi:hypothetical protein